MAIAKQPKNQLENHINTGLDSGSADRTSSQVQFQALKRHTEIIQSIDLLAVTVDRNGLVERIRSCTHTQQLDRHAGTVRYTEFWAKTAYRIKLACQNRRFMKTKTGQIQNHPKWEPQPVLPHTITKSTKILKSKPHRCSTIEHKHHNISFTIAREIKFQRRGAQNVQNLFHHKSHYKIRLKIPINHTGYIHALNLLKQSISRYLAKKLKREKR